MFSCLWLELKANAMRNKKLRPAYQCDEFIRIYIHNVSLQRNSSELDRYARTSAFISHYIPGKDVLLDVFLQISVSQQAILEPKSMGGQFQAKRPQMIASNST